MRNDGRRWPPQSVEERTRNRHPVKRNTLSHSGTKRAIKPSLPQLAENLTRQVTAMTGPFQPILLIAVALGGAVGAVLRYLLVLAAARWNASLGVAAGFPLGVALANILGGLLIGVLAVVLTKGDGAGPIRAFLITGLLGGFTTFSAFSLDVVSLWEEGRFDLALDNIAVNVVGAIAAAAIGALLARAALSGG